MGGITKSAVASYNRARYYDTTVRKFLSEDAEAFDGRLVADRILARTQESS